MGTLCAIFISHKATSGTGDNKLLILYLVFAATITTRYRKNISDDTPVTRRKRELAARSSPRRRTRKLAPWSTGDGARKLEVQEMRIERRFTKAGQSAYAEIEFRKATSEIKNPDGSIVFRLDGHRRSRAVLPGRGRHPGAEVFPQGRRSARPEEGRGERRSFLPVAFGCRRGGAEGPAEGRAVRLGNRCAPGLRPPCRHLDLLGLEGRLFLVRRRCARLPRRACLYARHPARRPELPAVVQHRPALGLWHRRPRPGPLLCRPLHRQADQVQVRLRASAAACLLHPVRRRRPRQRRRHHGPVGARSAPVQVRLRHRLQLLLCCAAKAKSFPAAAVPPA